ncbi:MAG: addiction module protein [Xenococcus sp. (in: cyanobacteria)]
MSNLSISLKDLSVAQKLSLMERIWVDLEKQPSEIYSPKWHSDILARRMRSIKSNESEFFDWANAKKTAITKLFR